jgi:hypothetical protein
MDKKEGIEVRRKLRACGKDNKPARDNLVIIRTGSEQVEEVAKMLSNNGTVYIGLHHPCRGHRLVVYSCAAIFGSSAISEDSIDNEAEQ